jgi:hypothetical protein
MYDFKVVGENGSGLGPDSETVQARSLGTFTKNLDEVTTPTESFAPNRIRSVAFQEVTAPIESLSTQQLSVPPASSVIMLCGYAGNTVFTFESALIHGFYDTPEIHFGYPDKEKTLVEIRFGSESPTPHTIIVYYSVDGGVTWNLIGSSVVGLGVTGFVYPWVTSNKFLIRFFGTGLHLYFYEVYAIPSGWKIQTT